MHGTVVLDDDSRLCVVADALFCFLRLPPTWISDPETFDFYTCELPEDADFPLH
jgi:hypothetical protein